MQKEREKNDPLSYTPRADAAAIGRGVPFALHRLHDSLSRGSEQLPTVVPGVRFGLMDPGELKALKAAVETLDEQLEFLPDHEDFGSRVKIVFDQYGSAYFAIKVYTYARTAFDWYYLRFYKASQPNFDVPPGGDITVGAVPVERPVTITAGATVIPAGSTATSADLVVGDSTVAVKQMPAAGTPTVQVSVPFPEGYNLGQLAARFYFYTILGVAGTVTLGIRAKAVTGGVAIPSFTSAWTEVTTTVSNLNGLNITPVTALFDAVPAALRGDDIHMEIRRNGGTYGLAASLSKVQVFYQRNRLTDRVAA